MTTLFAAFAVATGKVQAAHKKRRRRKAFLDFMDVVVAVYPKRRLEVILDNFDTHKKNEDWLARHSLATFHYTPTRASWLNQVEGWFSILQGQSLTGASFTSVEQLKEHIDAFIERYNENAEPFVWTKSKVHQRRVKGRRLSDLRFRVLASAASRLALEEDAHMLGMRNTVAQTPSGGRSFIELVEVDHGPSELLGSFFIEADAAARRAGVLLTIGDFSELAAVNRANSSNWVPLIPLFDPCNGALSPEEAFCLIGRNGAGEAVATHAVRLYDWPRTSFAEEAESLRLFYADPAAMKYPNETCTVSAAAAREVTGRVVYSGAAWVRPDYRGRSLALVLPRLAKAYAFTRWRPDFIVSWMTEATYRRGLIDHVGYTTVDWDVQLRNSFIGDLRFAFLSMREACLLDYVRDFSTSMAQVDRRIGERRA